MNIFVFTRAAEKKFLKLEKSIQKRVTTKLVELKDHEHIDSALKSLTDFAPATHRLRIGQYRLILERTSESAFLILDVGDRSDIYR